MAHFITVHKGPIEMWTAMACTLGIMSVVFRETAAFRLCQHVYLGLALGLGVVRTFFDVLLPRFFGPLLDGAWYWGFAVVAGSMWYFIYSRKHFWISRIMQQTMMGMGAGLVFKGWSGTNMPQIFASLKPLWGRTVPAQVPDANGVLHMGPTHKLASGEMFSNFVFFFVLITVMSYFFFSFRHRNQAMIKSTQLGRIFLMFTFGAMFGSTVMARLSLLIGRMDFIINQFLLPLLGMKARS